MTREQALAELGQMINMQSKLQDHPGLNEINLEEADRQLRSAPGAERSRWERLHIIREVLTWERCAGCEKDYRFPHLCREHLLCGLCHPPVDRSPR